MGGTDSHMTAHPSDGSVEASGRMTGQVLVVDDDALVCKLLEARLGKHGFRVAWTTSAETALQRLDADAVDAIVSDVSMTGPRTRLSRFSPAISSSRMISDFFAKSCFMNLRISEK